MNPVDLALLLVSAASGAALLLFTSGRVGGYLVQPRGVQGLPTGKGATPSDADDTDSGSGDGGNNGGGNNNNNGGGDNGNNGNGGGEGNGGGGKGDDPNDGSNGGEGDNFGGIPYCKYGLLVTKLLDEVVTELEPYAISRASVPYLDLLTAPWNLDTELPGHTPGYYVTAAILRTVKNQGLDPNDFAKGDFLHPGCLLPADAFNPDTPLRRLLDAWNSGSEEGEGG